MQQVWSGVWASAFLQAPKWCSCWGSEDKSLSSKALGYRAALSLPLPLWLRSVLHRRLGEGGQAPFHYSPLSFSDGSLMVILVTITNWVQQTVAMGTHRAIGGNEQEPWCVGLEANSEAWFLPCLHLLLHLSPTCASYSSYSLEPQVSICCAECLP